MPRILLTRCQTEIKHLYSISLIPGLAFLTRHLDSLKDLSFVLAIILNILILLAYGVDLPTQAITSPRCGTHVCVAGAGGCLGVGL
jgi:hypothetical protein